MEIEKIEAALMESQDRVGLSFRAPATFVLCDDWGDFARFTPWLRVSHGVGAIRAQGLYESVPRIRRADQDLHEPPSRLLDR